MAVCFDPCHFTVNDDGELEPNWTCTETCLHQCIEIEEGSDGGIDRRPGITSCSDECLGEHFGSPRSWPKRTDSHMSNDPNNRGFPTGGSATSDDPTFIGSTSPRAFVPAGEPCTILTAPFGPSYRDDAQNTTHAEQGLNYTNQSDCPVLVDVQASGWYADVAATPTADSGGARWLGEVRALISSDGGTTFDETMEWQRAHEVSLATQVNPDYDPDPRGICAIATGADSVGEAMEAAFNQAAICLDQLATEVAENFGSFSYDPGGGADPGDGGAGGDYAFPINNGAYNYPGQNCGGGYGACRTTGCGFASLCGCGSSRKHAGEDLCTPCGTDAIAITAGTVRHGGSGSGGQTLHLEGTDGNLYTYLHLQARIPDGTVVAAGTVVGAVGASANGVCHLHFEVHPGVSSPAGRRGCYCGSNPGTSVNPRSLLSDIYATHGSGTGSGSVSTLPGQGTTAGGDPVIIENQEVHDRAEALRACLDEFALENDLVDLFDGTCNNIAEADRPALGNPTNFERRVKTGGAWQAPIVVYPGETLRVETRSRFARWRHSAAGPDSTFCQAGGSARAGKISMRTHPIHGGTDCSEFRAGGSWYRTRTA